MICSKPFAMFITAIVCTTVPLGFAAFAQDGRQFEPMEYDGLPYQQLACNVKGAKKPSLVIFLRGGHARGNDNQAQIQVPAVRDIKDFILTSNIPAYFLVPQCPNGYEWISNRGRPGCKEKVVGLVRKYAAEKGIDTDRIYICSVSMGSWASWVIVQENPELFAAAFIASGAPKGVSAEHFSSIPLYVTVGSQERTADSLKRFTSDIKKAGGSVNFDILTGCGHPEACSEAFAAKRLNWIFSQRKTRRAIQHAHLPLVCVAEIEVHPENIEAYLAAAKMVGAESVAQEPGVVCIFPMQKKEQPTQIRIIEIYRDEAAYKAHLETPNFKKYKTGTLQMVKSMNLAPMQPLDPEHMNLIFKKGQDK